MFLSAYLGMGILDRREQDDQPTMRTLTRFFFNYDNRTETYFFIITRLVLLDLRRHYQGKDVKQEEQEQQEE